MCAAPAAADNNPASWQRVCRSRPVSANMASTRQLLAIPWADEPISASLQSSSPPRSHSSQSPIAEVVLSPRGQRVQLHGESTVTGAEVRAPMGRWARERPGLVRGIGRTLGPWKRSWPQRSRRRRDMTTATCESTHKEMHSINGGSPDVATSQGDAADSRRYSAWKPHHAPTAHRPAGPNWVPASSQCARSGGTAAKYPPARFLPGRA